MNKFLSLLIIFFLLTNNSNSNEKIFCSETKSYINHNLLKNLNEVEIEIINKKKWYLNIFSIVRNNGWIGRELKKNHRAKIIFKFNDGFKCQDLAKIRFHGDNPDHYKVIDDFHIISSLNIQLSQSNIENITQFKLFLPNTRGDENEIFATNFLKSLKYFAPKTKKLKVKIDGVETEYLFQEKISKELVESEGFPEGPIIEGDQRFLTTGMRNLHLGRIVNKNWSSRNWRNAYISLNALSKLNQEYLDFYNNRNNFKVYKPYAFYYSNFALNEENTFNKKNYNLQFYDDLISTMNPFDHALVPDNRTFYYNYFENYFYPIYYDGDIALQTKNINNVNLIKLKKNRLIIEAVKKIDKEKLNYTNNLSGAKKINKDSISLYLNSITHNLKYISNDRAINKEKILSYKHTNYFSRFDIKDIRLIFFKDYPNNFYVCDHNLIYCEEEQFELDEIGNILSQTYKKNSNYKYIFVTNDFKNYSQKNYLPIKKNKWTNLENRSLNIKYIKNKIKIDINEVKKIINIEQLEKDGRVFIYSDKKIENWNINFNSKFNYNQNTTISSFSESLDGCITIYESKIENLNFNISNGVCEDSLNIVRSQGNIDKIYISNSFKDGLDMDFSNININEIEIDKSGNDCVDMSFGNYDISLLNLYRCEDNAVSIGEKSNLNSNSLYVKNSLNALAVKDSSKVSLKLLFSNNNNFCFKLYNKKQEFLGGLLRLNKLVCDSKYIIDKNSYFQNNEL